MSGVALLDELRRRGVELAPAGDGRLHYRAPKGTLTPELRQALAVHKAELLAVLAAEAILGTATVPGDRCPRHHRRLTYREFRDGRCSWCHPEDRPEWRGRPDILEALERINAEPAPAPSLTCLECGAPLEAGRKYRCPGCVERAAEEIRARTAAPRRGERQ